MMAYNMYSDIFPFLQYVIYVVYNYSVCRKLFSLWKPIVTLFYGGSMIVTFKSFSKLSHYLRASSVKGTETIAYSLKAIIQEHFF